MSELQGPRIPGEERSGRRRPLGWIIGGLLALLLLALLVPFACQALVGGGADTQGQGPGGQQKAVAQEADDGQQGGGGARDAEGTKNTGATGAGEDAQTGPAGGNGAQASKNTTAEADGATGSGAKQDSGKAPIERGGAKTGGDLPETGGMPPASLLVVGTTLLLTGSTALSAVVRRRSL